MGILDRMIRAAKLDVSLYEEVEKDAAATNQALLVVVITSICSGIGTAISSGAGGFVFGLFAGVVSALVGWLIWSFITYFIGTRIFKGPQTEATYGQLLRCIGFSDSPRALAILSFIPVLGGIVAFVAMIWSLVAMVVAVRQALDFTTGRAVVTCVVGFIALIVISAVVGGLAGGLIALVLRR
jgi:hypothetical protein